MNKHTKALQSASEIVGEWAQGMKEDTKRLLNPLPRKSPYVTHHSDGRPMTQEERWEANAK